VPLLLSVVGLLALFLYVFSMLGLQLYAGAWHYECVDDVTGETESQLRHSGEWGCGGSRSCPHGWSCVKNDVPAIQHSVAGFDNVGLGMLTMFQVRSRVEGPDVIVVVHSPPPLTRNPHP